MSVLVSGIPAHHPDKTAIDAAVRSLLAQLADSWSVRINPAQTRAWWTVTIERPRDGYCSGFFVEPDQQTVDGVVSAIRAALDDAR